MKIKSQDIYREYFKESIELGLNPHQIPRINKIVIQSGIKKLVSSKNIKQLSIIKEDYTDICQQTPVIVKSQKNIAPFAVRLGDVVAIYATLRKNSMYDFLDRFLYLSVPRIRYFNGFSHTIFDKGGNFTIGVADMSIFYELDPSIRKVLQYGCSITFQISNSNNIEEIKKMLNKLHFVFETK